MEDLITAIVSAGFIVIIIGILAAIAPFFYMFFMYKQIKKMQKKMDDLVKYTNYIARCEYDKKVKTEAKDKDSISKNP